MHILIKSADSLESFSSPHYLDSFRELRCNGSKFMFATLDFELYYFNTPSTEAWVSLGTDAVSMLGNDWKYEYICMFPHNNVPHNKNTLTACDSQHGFSNKYTSYNCNRQCNSARIKLKQVPEMYDKLGSCGNLLFYLYIIMCGYSVYSFHQNR